MAAAIAGAAVAASSQLRGSEKSQDIEDILQALQDDGESNDEPSRNEELLQRLRSHTTSPGGLDPLLTKRGVSICCRYGFNSSSLATSRYSLRCLCNILLLAAPTRQMFVDENYIPQTVERMKKSEADDELQTARLLLLCTYGTTLNFDSLFEQYHLAEVMNTNIARHAKLFTKDGQPPTNAEAACSETLKLLYNLAVQYPKRALLFRDSLVPVLEILNAVHLPSPPLQPPVSWVVNVLVPLLQLGQNEQETKKSIQNLVFPESNSSINVDRAVDILDRATRAYKDEEMDRQGSALVQVLLGISEIAPASSKARLRGLLLPSREEQEQVLGKGDSLSARLLRFCTCPMSPHLRELVPTLLFELSDKDEQQFVRNVGYGFAAGFLLSRGSLLPSSSAPEPRNATESEPQRSDGVHGDCKADEKDSRSAPGDDLDINPITGQRRDKELESDMPEMSEEEKEREAERLFILFERLRATGVMDVENPLAKAVREGRFEEVD